MISTKKQQPIKIVACEKNMYVRFMLSKLWLQLRIPKPASAELQYG